MGKAHRIDHYWTSLFFILKIFYPVWKKNEEESLCIANKDFCEGKTSFLISINLIFNQWFWHKILIKYKQIYLRTFKLTMQMSLPVPLKFWKPCINFRVYNFFSVDFALKVVKWSDTQTIKLQLWDIAGN